MKIKDVLIKEYQMGNIGQPGRTAQPAAAPKGQATQPAAAPAVFKPADTSFSTNYSQRNRAGFVPNVATSTPGPQSQQNAQPAPKKQAPKKQAPKKQAPKKPVDAMAGSDASATNQSSGMTAQDRFAGQAKTDAQTGQNNLGVDEPRQADSYSTATGPSATGQDAPSAELDRLKQLAIGQPTLNQQASQQGAAMAQAASTPPQSGPLGVQAQSGAAFGQATPQADNPNPPPAQAAQPAPEPAAQAAEPVKTAQDFAPQPNISPDTGLSTAPKPVTTGTGAKTNITTGSDDEMAWRSKQTGIVDVTKYPGPGNWDPKTGRTKQDPNKPGFFDRLFGKKTAPAAPVQGQGSQPVELPPGFAESSNEIDRIRKLSGLR